MQTTMVQSSDVDHFYEIFKGFEFAHGEYAINNKDEAGKLSGLAKTIALPALSEDYKNHLLGKKGIGIIPLMKDGTCWFGAIDLDIKGSTKLKEDHFILEARIRALGLPLIVCRSKSDGAHLYLFGSEPIDARLMQSRLMEFAAILGYGGCEVFPKQVKRKLETDYGNWINIPYFGSTRQCIHEGKQYEQFDSFYNIVKQNRMDNKRLSEFRLNMSEEFNDGPPCLQQLSTLGFTSGGRNNALLNVAIYFKKSTGDSWQDFTKKFNESSIDPSLPMAEVTQILKSVGKKDYNYTCKISPLVEHCQRKECLKREHGVSNGQEKKDIQLPITSLTKHVAKDSIRWSAHTNEIDIYFTSDELLSFDIHRKKIMDALNIVLPTIKSDSFIKQIDHLITNCEIIYDPEEASETGVLKKAVKMWFQQTSGAANFDDMVMDKWLHDEEANKIYFEPNSLKKYLDNYHKIKVTRQQDFWKFLKTEFDAEEGSVIIKGINTKVWSIKNVEFQNDNSLLIPDVNKAIQEM